MARIIIHPCEPLSEELSEIQLSSSELARRLEVPANRITEILNGERAITGDTALRLAHFLGTTAQFWLNWQSAYELKIAEQKVGKMIRTLPRLRRQDHAHAHSI
jgi:antitoxin HigA-1